MQQGVPAQKNGIGTAGFILGLIALCTFWLLGIIAAIMGIIGLILGAIGYWGKWKDAKLGLAGFIMGLIALILVVIISALFWSAPVYYF